MKFLFAGGGTAGHIEPALAVARGWLASHPSDEVFFIGTASGLENTLIPAAGFNLKHIPKVSIARSLSPSLMKVPIQLFSSIWATSKLLRGVDCAIGFGGYVSAPLYLAAALTRTPFVIHEQNARPGWANRMGAYLTKYCAVSYPVNGGSLSKAIVTGLPLRQDVLVALDSAAADWSVARVKAKSDVAAKYQIDSKKPLIFIFGGSQGSQAINAVIEESRAALNASGFAIIHGVGKNNSLPDSNDSYRALSYIDEMAQLYLAADLLIARSGAVTCAEATALAKYSLFVPLPIGNGEQSLNADALVASGRAEVVEQADFSARWLVENISRLISTSAEQSDAGDTRTADAVDKILSIIERAAKA